MGNLSLGICFLQAIIGGCQESKFFKTWAFREKQKQKQNARFLKILIRKVMKQILWKLENLEFLL